jgi:3-oxoadipate enol-lactonase
MVTFDIGPGEALHFVRHPPTGDHPICVFVNALTSDVTLWEAEIAPALRAAGLDTLAYNLRG